MVCVLIRRLDQRRLTRLCRTDHCRNIRSNYRGTLESLVPQELAGHPKGGRRDLFWTSRKRSCANRSMVRVPPISTYVRVEQRLSYRGSLAHPMRWYILGDVIIAKATINGQQRIMIETLSPRLAK